MTCAISAILNVMCPEVSPAGAWTKRTASGVQSRPVGIPVSRNRRSKRICGGAVQPSAVAPTGLSSAVFLGLAPDQQLCGTLSIPDLPGRFERDIQLGQSNLVLRRRIAEILLLPTKELDE